MTGYLFLAGAIGAEIFATSMLKASQSFSKVLPSILCVAGYVVCYSLFGRAVDRMNLGIAYAIWCGVGMVATSAISALLFHEGISTAGVFGIVLIIIGCMILSIWGSAS